MTVQANTERAQDWMRFGTALIGRNQDRRRAASSALNYVLKILHTGKNVIVEEARRWHVELRPSKW